jgi:iron complex outermembrane receptor protein
MKSRHLIGSMGAGAASAALLGVWGAPALAAEASDDVFVTARERTETLQQVPAQVSVFTSQTIEAKGVELPRDFIQSTPNATVVETQNAGTTFVVIRGISQARNSEPSVAVIVDGVPQTQPAQFNQELVDIDQIEVLKGPQGALYGRNAIGGAILIKTKQPTDHWEGRITAGYENGPGGKAQGVISGPLTDQIGVRAALSYVNTSGHIENTFLHQKADPVSDLNGRLKLVYKPTDKFTAALNLSMDRLWTQALYFNIVYYNLPFLPFPPYSVLTTPDVNNTSLPVTVNNPGKNNRALYDASLKLDYDTDVGTFSSISGYNLTKEILTGDAFDFLPPPQSLLFLFTGFDQNQSQFLRVRTLTQEFRFTSPADSRFRWIAGAQLFGTDRFISTGNEWDTGHGVAPVFYTPTTPVPTFPIGSSHPNPQATFLADSQNNFAWAAYLDTSTNVTDDVEVSLNVRYDHDHRKNTTDTPTAYLPNVAGFPPGVSGQIRERSWSSWQPQFILRWQATQNFNVYGSYSRGFRSGGFNQTGVGAIAFGSGFVGVGDQFKAERSESWEVGFKSRFLHNRVTFNGAAYLTDSKNGYFFIFLAANSTQNLGNIPKVRYVGFDMDAVARITDDLRVEAGFGYTDSEVKQYYPGFDFRLGQQAPLVSKYTFNLAVQYRPRLSDNLNALVRLDFNRIGRTYFWEADTVPAGTPTLISRNPVNLLDLRIGVEGKDWSLVAWAKNLNNHIYNSEYSPGGFAFKAQPRRMGVDLTKRF